jgi:hypothetical protein
MSKTNPVDPIEIWSDFIEVFESSPTAAEPAITLPVDRYGGIDQKYISSLWQEIGGKGRPPHIGFSEASQWRKYRAVCLCGWKGSWHDRDDFKRRNKEFKKHIKALGDSR